MKNEEGTGGLNLLFEGFTISKIEPRELYYGKND